MMKRLLTFVAVAAATVSAFAQRGVTGTVIEGDTQEPLAMTTVKLLRTDSTLVKGGMTATNGSFSIEIDGDLFKASFSLPKAYRKTPAPDAEAEKAAPPPETDPPDAPSPAKVVPSDAPPEAAS